MIRTPRLTPKKKELLNQMGLYDGMDILMHYPFRYETIVSVPFHEWKEKDTVAVEGRVASAFRTARFGRNRSVTHVRLATEEETLELAIFNRPWIKSLPPGERLTVFGRYEGGRKVTVMQYNQIPLTEQIGMHPIYHLKEGLTQSYFQTLVKEAWQLNGEEIVSFIPEHLQQAYRLLSRKEALYHLHFPTSLRQAEQAVKTMKYEEFLRFQIVMQARRHFDQELIRGTAKQFDEVAVWKLADTLPFVLTNGQRNAIKAVLEDLADERMMYRLIQGDVGCGKTVVAMLAMYACALSDHQCALMVPTELLAKQHVRSMQRLFDKTSIRIAALYASMPPQEKQAVYEGLEHHQIDMVVGTHALFQEAVRFARLGLIVTDEQQRFGVNQRRRLLAKGDNADILMMSATPIPRTLATGLFGDMDVTTIEEVPQGKRPIITRLIKENSIRSIKRELEQAMDEGQQIYMVCAAIEKNEEHSARSAKDLYENLSREWQGKYTVGWLHGKMKSEEKDAIMERFLQKECNVLVSTTVVEVGVDVPSANYMVIYDAHRFGLSQLHQLRGRVGRGRQQGYCFLLTSSRDPDALERMQVLVDHTDGFEIARKDLLLRGPGDLLGQRQSGLPSFVLGNVIEDQAILLQSQRDAAALLKQVELYPQVQQLLLEYEKKDRNYFD